MTKMIQLKPYTISNAHQLGLQVGRPEWSATVSFFPAISNYKNNIFSFHAIFQSQYTELAALFMKFPTRALIYFEKKNIATME